ncbi:MAG: hypothetical protein MUE81_07415 [Thermoflexibacter sp.]|nr:hypothetical protein [Thermoflexibacter sp.]
MLYRESVINLSAAFSAALSASVLSGVVPWGTVSLRTLSLWVLLFPPPQAKVKSNEQITK